MPWPGIADVAESVLVIDRSPVGVSVSVSVVELLAEFGSVTDAGAATVAVFTSVPVAVAGRLPVTVNVVVPPGARVTVALRLPLPDAAGHVDPAEAEQVHATPVTFAGTVSATVAPVAVDGPPFVATIVYDTDVPGTSVVAPSVLVIVKSAVGTSVSVSVAVLLAVLGSVVPAATVAVAVLASDPVAVDEIVAVNVNVAVPLGNRSTVVDMLPEPDAGHVDPAEAVHVQVAPDSAAGSVSATAVDNAADGPAFDTAIV